MMVRNSPHPVAITSRKPRVQQTAPRRRETTGRFARQGRGRAKIGAGYEEMMFPGSFTYWLTMPSAAR
jgi:hypothetical protein